MSASGPVKPCESGSPWCVNFFSADLPPPGGLFEIGSQFTLTVKILPGSSPGTYLCDMGKTYGETTVAYYTVIDSTVVKITPTQSELQPCETGEPNSVPLKITTTDSLNKPVPRRPLKFTVSVPLKSIKNLLPRGGHNHSGDGPNGNPPGRPLGIFKEVSSLKTYKAVGDLQDSYSFEASTDDNGELSLKYIAPIAGGTVKVEVVPKGGVLGDGSSNIATLDVRFPSLVLLPENLGLYTKTGGKLIHPGAGLPDYDYNNKLDGNHYVFKPGLSDLQKAFNDYYTNTGEKLNVNDLSLPKGGIFDLEGKWGKEIPIAHGCHRTGHSVDIEKFPPLSTALLEAFGQKHWNFIYEGPHKWAHFEWGVFSCGVIPPYCPK